MLHHEVMEFKIKISTIFIILCFSVWASGTWVPELPTKRSKGKNKLYLTFFFFQIYNGSYNEYNNFSPNFLVTKLVGIPDTSNSKDLLDSIPLCTNYQVIFPKI